jgi:hypothetical protein
MAMQQSTSRSVTRTIERSNKSTNQQRQRPRQPSPTNHKRDHKAQQYSRLAMCNCHGEPVYRCHHQGLDGRLGVCTELILITLAYYLAFIVYSVAFDRPFYYNLQTGIGQFAHPSTTTFAPTEQQPRTCSTTIVKTEEHEHEHKHEQEQDCGSTPPQ